MVMFALLFAAVCSSLLLVLCLCLTVIKEATAAIYHSSIKLKLKMLILNLTMATFPTPCLTLNSSNSLLQIILHIKLPFTTNILPLPLVQLLPLLCLPSIRLI